MRKTYLARSRSSGNMQVLTYLLIGFAAGGVLGYIFMGIAHSVLEARAEAMAEENSASGLQLMSAYPRTGSTVHTLCTSNGSPYLNFQTRIMYQTYMMVQAQPEGEHMAAFTRILHRTIPDVLMQEVPSWRADPLNPACDIWCEFPVADRANAVHQWLNASREDPGLIQAPWLLMLETDYVWMRPLQQPPPAEDASQPGWAFRFSYIACQDPRLHTVTRRMFPARLGSTARLPDTGPAPVLMRVADWFRVVGNWERLAAWIETSPEAKQKLGWVREMYGFSIATALAGIALRLEAPPDSPLISQPPMDDALGAAAMYHYTWESQLSDENGTEVWRFDKRTYTEQSIEVQTPHIPPLPEYRPGLMLRGGKPVTATLMAALAEMIGQMNEAVNRLDMKTT